MNKKEERGKCPAPFLLCGGICGIRLGRSGGFQLGRNLFQLGGNLVLLPARLILHGNQLTEGIQEDRTERRRNNTGKRNAPVKPRYRVIPRVLCELDNFISISEDKRANHTSDTKHDSGRFY